MAETKKTSFAKKKIFGIPAPLVAVVAALGAYLLYKKYKSQASATATPTDTTATVGQPGYAYDDSGGGGGGGGPTAGNPPASISTSATGTGSDYSGTGATATTLYPGLPLVPASNAYINPAVFTPGSLNPTTPGGALASNPAQGGHSL